MCFTTITMEWYLFAKYYGFTRVSQAMGKNIEFLLKKRNEMSCVKLLYFKN